MTRTLLTLSVIAVGLMAGLFAAFSYAVMPGLRRTDDDTFVRAMRAINEAILNPVFGVIFAGALVLLTASVVALSRRRPRSPLDHRGARVVRADGGGHRGDQRSPQRPSEDRFRVCRRIAPSIRDPLGRLERRARRAEHGRLRRGDRRSVALCRLSAETSRPQTTLERRRHGPGCCRLVMAAISPGPSATVTVRFGCRTSPNGAPLIGNRNSRHTPWRPLVANVRP